LYQAGDKPNAFELKKEFNAIKKYIILGLLKLQSMQANNL